MLLLPALLSAAALPAVSAWQVPFMNPPQPPIASPSSSRSSSGPVFTLQHAIHLNHHNRTLPPLHQRYTAASLAALSADSGYSPAQSLRLTPRIGQRPNDHAAFQAKRRSNFYSKQAKAQGRLWTQSEMRDMELASALEWDEVEVLVPDVEDPETVGNLARMSSNAYRTPDKPENWYDLTQGWNTVSRFAPRDHLCSRSAKARSPPNE